MNAECFNKLGENTFQARFRSSSTCPQPSLQLSIAPESSCLASLANQLARHCSNFTFSSIPVIILLGFEILGISASYLFKHARQSCFWPWSTQLVSSTSVLLSLCLWLYVFFQILKHLNVDIDHIVINEKNTYLGG